MGPFRVLASTCILVTFMYVSHQLVRFTDLSWWMTIALVAFLAGLFTLVIGSFLFYWKERNLDHSPWRDWLLDGALTVMAYINFLVTIVILRDIFYFGEFLLRIPAQDFMWGTEATLVMMGIPVVLLILGHSIVRAGPRLTKVPIRFPELPEAFEETKVIHITDLHISPSLPAKFVEKMVEKVNSLKPDIIVFTGDILDSFVEKHAEEFESLKKLFAPLGIYYVPGNHEYYWNPSVGLQAFRDVGFRVLINETAEIKKDGALLQISGIPDPSAKHFENEGPNYGKIQGQLKPDSFKILLSHQPSLAKIIETLGYHLQFSGHTHGGQFFPWNWLIIFFERYSQGLYRVGNMRLYVNQGTGYWGPRLRLGTYCELAEIILRRPAKKE